MYESISKNNELENEMTLDMSYFWYSDIGKVTAAFATCKIQVPATLSGNSEPLAMVASCTAQSLIRGSSWTKDVGGSSLFCNSNFENTYNSSILFYFCTGSTGAPVES